VAPSGEGLWRSNLHEAVCLPPAPRHHQQDRTRWEIGLPSLYRIPATLGYTLFTNTLVLLPLALLPTQNGNQCYRYTHNRTYHIHTLASLKRHDKEHAGVQILKIMHNTSITASSPDGEANIHCFAFWNDGMAHYCYYYYLRRILWFTK